MSILDFLTAPLRKIHLRRSIADSVVTWLPFLRGQGTILLVFLLLGAGLGWISLKFGQSAPGSAVDGKLVEFRQIDLGGHTVYEELDVEGFSHLSVFATALQPKASRINVLILPNDGQTVDRSVSFESGDSTWSRLDEPVSSKRVTLAIRSLQPDATKPSQADVLVFLSKH